MSVRQTPYYVPTAIPLCGTIHVVVPPRNRSLHTYDGLQLSPLSSAFVSDMPYGALRVSEIPPTVRSKNSFDGVQSGPLAATVISPMPLSIYATDVPLGINKHSYVGLQREPTHFNVGSVVPNWNYPRTAALLNGGLGSYSSTLVNNAGKTDLLLLGMWKGWGSGPTGMNNAIASFKAVNANILIFNYENVMEIPGTASGNTVTGDAAHIDLSNKCNANFWWGYTNGIAHTGLTSEFSGAYQVNITDWVPTDSGGERYPAWYAEWGNTNFFSVANFDGYFMDNVFYQPRVAADWELVGSVQATNNTTVSTRYRAGIAAAFTRIKQLQPNIFTWASSSDYGPTPNNDIFGSNPQYSNLVNGGVMEGAIGASYSPSFAKLMDWYYKQSLSTVSPQMNVIVCNGTAGDEVATTYGLCVTLMGNGFFAYQPGGSYASYNWDTIYDNKIGQPLEGWQTAASTLLGNGVWKRNFQGAVVLLNPPGNGVQSFTIYGHAVTNMAAQTGLILYGLSPTPDQPIANSNTVLPMWRKNLNYYIGIQSSPLSPDYVAPVGVFNTTWDDLPPYAVNRNKYDGYLASPLSADQSVAMSDSASLDELPPRGSVRLTSYDGFCPVPNMLEAPNLMATQLGWFDNPPYGIGNVYMKDDITGQQKGVIPENEFPPPPPPPSPIPPPQPPSGTAKGKSNLGSPVTSRKISWRDLVIRSWGSEFFAPDKDVYELPEGNDKDSTDQGNTGFYRKK